MKKCINCCWFESDEDGDGYYCTANPPDYKGMYAKTYPEYKCKLWEPSDMDYEVKADFYMERRNDVR